MRSPSGAPRSPVAWRLSALLLLVAMALPLKACGPETLVIGLEPRMLQDVGSPVKSVAFSPDGALFAAGSADGTFRVWGVTDSELADWPLLHARSISTGEREDSHSFDVAFSPDGRTLAFGLPDGTVRLWRLSGVHGDRRALVDLQIASLQTLGLDESKICSLSFAPDGRALAAGAGSGAVYLWRVSDGIHLQSPPGHTDVVVSLAFSPDGGTLASASLDGTTKLWDIATATLVHELEKASVTTGVAFSSDGSMLATSGAADHQLQLWRVDDWSLIRELESARAGMGNVAFSPDGTIVARGNAWCEVRWWRAADGRLLQTARSHKDSVNSVAFSPDGKRLASGSLDGTVKLWRVIGGMAGP